ncbi:MULTISPECIES: tyrosine-type recombinase/integrase [Bacillus]|uniref:tyrosine-type recombinase/integrase n=1 Tax=Bacillus TaxID=1386 RepID=UPI000BA553E1|nr:MULTISPECIES: tyrosine-type recombinase/integrase [Bacillus amyloliquefaciens group]MEA1005906.1 tyrosine-type recombinase/integrase [Bacillus velezensis]PAK29715.1 site-specific integrase [Bacillus velezensis]QXP96353.1 tyrosine-type recombinase/integrase [Bacillus velezensis]UHH02213.1 tyrosine-type recombinase/integrase [Bacillus amyloliquefaciens]ULR21959.1 tyrosine-type recombinase/integrase [Bacillus velezensis]
MANAVDAIKTKRDINRMKNALNGRDKDMFVFGVSLGLRISDLLTLKNGDLRGQTHLKLREGKTGKMRPIKLSKTVQLAAAKLAGPDDAYIFRSRKGVNKPISRVQAYNILKAAADRAGLDIAIGTHTLRKTFGYQLHAKGIDITRIMKIFGHSSEAQTLRYIGITAEEIEAAYEAIEV